MKKGFYNGLRFHRAEPNFVIQIGDPQSRDMTKQDVVGHAAAAASRSASPRSPRSGGTSAAPSAWRHSGSAARRRQPVLHHAARRTELDGKYTVFGKVIKGMDVAAKIQKADVLKKASVRE